VAYLFFFFLLLFSASYVAFCLAAMSVAVLERKSPSDCFRATLEGGGGVVPFERAVVAAEDAAAV
jgi:hypothetical protein